MAYAADDRKLRELILYIADRAMEDPHMGALKLNKVLFHIDFGAYLHLGAPITGHPYFKLREGPAPRHLVDVRETLLADGSARMKKEDVGMAHPLDRIVPLRKADLTMFSRRQIRFADSVMSELATSSGTAVSDETHLLVGWNLARMYETIPYETAFLGRATPEDIARGRELARLNGWA